MSKDQYVGADEAKLDLILRQAESRLQAQLSLAIAADQRAMTFASILATGAAALIAWAITHDADEVKLFPIVLLIVGTIGAAGCALWSAAPVAWNSPGDAPVSWIDDIAEDKDDLRSNKAAMADHYADMIAENGRLMATNGNWLSAALTVTFVTLIVGGLAALIWQLSPSTSGQIVANDALGGGGATKFEQHIHVAGGVDLATRSEVYRLADATHAATVQAIDERARRRG